MKIALCHLDLSMGPQEKNIEKLCRAVEMAGERGAEWTITPETAVQGYHFYKTNPAQRLPEQPEPGLVPLLESVKQYKQYLFLGAGEYDTDTHCNFNTCFVFGPDGTLLSRHRKNHSHEFGAENWVKNDTSVRTVVCSNVKVGPLVCADSWYIEDGPMRLEKEGARILAGLQRMRGSSPRLGEVLSPNRITADCLQSDRQKSMDRFYLGRKCLCGRRKG